MKRLNLPVAWARQSLCGFSVSQSDVEVLFGPPHSHLENSLEVAGPTDYWAFEFDCGLQVVLEYPTGPDCLIVVADAPETDHVLNHLRLPWPLPPDQRVELQPKSAERWQLFRQDDNGHQFIIKEFAFEREANCELQKYESLSHKQTYWLQQKKADY
jgi:hypothetical protein